MAFDIGAIFQREGTHLCWERLADDHVVGAPTGQPVLNDQHYFVIRMKEMFLEKTRILWRKYYPLLHGYTDYAGSLEHSIAGPGQLKELGDAGLDRMVNVNYRLTGPTAYRGGDVSMLMGLYAIPGDDAAKALVTTVSSLAAIGGIALGQVPKLADAVKQGVESVLSLNDTKLQIGVRDTFYQSNPLRSGYHVGIAAARANVPFDKLWLRDGKLVEGDDPVVGQPYEDNDYVLIEVERREQLDEWAGLPGVVDFDGRFAAILRDGGLNIADKKGRMHDLWPSFAQSIDESRQLVRPDRERIKQSVADDLKGRLSALELGNPFVETRSWTTGKVAQKPPEAFDFLDVRVDGVGAAGRLPARGNPF